jgi:cyclophilin family peptidyl-prolyl cis-trans isomerase
MALARASQDEFTLILSGLDSDPDFTVRAAIASALGDVGDPMAVGVLFGMLKDPDPRVLPAVLDGLRKARGNDALETLRTHLEHADPAVRAAAATGVAALGAKGMEPALLAAWHRCRNEADLDARLAVVDALATLGGRASWSALGEIVSSDPVRAVRLRAAAALSKASQTAPDPGPEVTSRRPLDYRTVLAPYDPLPGEKLYSPRALLHTRRGTIEIVLDVIETPLTTATFIDLARRGFFDGLTFHRVEPGFVVQGGDPRADGTGGPDFTQRCELGERPFGRGAVGMALSGRDTGGSQFFITQTPQPHLDAAYTLFGQVTKGMETVDALVPGDAIDRVEIWTGHE